MVIEMVNAFLLVFAAEMGDKSQIIAMTFATKYNKRDVLLGVSIAAIFNHGLAVLLGRYLSKIIPLIYMQVIAGFAFLIFGFMSLKDEELVKFKASKILGPVTTVAIVFFISELGDKTQLAAMTLASEAINPLFILVGTSSAMIATSALGILIGSRIGNRISDVIMKMVSSIVFIIFGLLKLYDVIPSGYFTPINIIIFVSFLLVIELYLILKLVDNRKRAISPIKEVAQRLYIQTETLKQSLDSICLGDDVCGKCSGKSCLVGFIRFIIKEARENGNYYNELTIDIDKLIRKDYDVKQIIKSLGLILADYHKYGWKDDEDFVVKRIKNALEILLFARVICETQDIESYIKEANKIDKRYAELLEVEIQYNLK